MFFDLPGVSYDPAEPYNHNKHEKESRMDEVRRGQIALLILRQQLRENGIDKALDLDVDDIAEAIGVPAWEVLDFLKDTIREVFERRPQPNLWDI